MSGRYANQSGLELRLAWGAAGQALKGQAESGDRHLVKAFRDGVLIAAMDGLGHGTEAATAARIAATTLELYAQESVLALATRCHQALAETRGVVMSLASFRESDNTLTWLGIGNVQGLLLRADRAATPARESLLLRGGVLGYQLPQLYGAVIQVAPGDVLVFATDGIKTEFADEIAVGEPPQQLADHIIGQWGRETDDALVVVAQFAGGRP